MKSVPTLRIVLTSLALFFALTVSAGAAVEEPSSQTFPLADGGRLSLENVNGDVKIEAWDGAEVKVEYTKRGDDQGALDRMKVEIDATPNRIDIETHYKKSDSRFGWGNNAGEVNFEIWVPRTARIDDVELVNGNLELRGLEGSVSASLVNGNLTARELGGDVDLETVNGQLSVHISRLETARSVRISSVNGSVEVFLPPDTDADLDVETVHGRIRNDFGLEVEKGRYVGRSMKGVLGRGGARIELENVNGSIEVRAE